jgi:fluoride exporter
MKIYQFILVGVGGLVGSVLRFFVGRWWAFDGSKFPFSTLLVNVVGSLILGFIIGLTQGGTSRNETIRLLLGVGFCGGFTTFSTFAYESVVLLHQKTPALALLNIGLSLMISLLAVFIGLWLARLF